MENLVWKSKNYTSLRELIVKVLTGKPDQNLFFTNSNQVSYS